MTSPDDAAGEQRRRRHPATDGPRKPRQSATQIYPQWDEITEAVMQEIVRVGKESGEYEAATEPAAFYALVARTVDRYPNWGITKSGVQALVGALREEFFGLGPLAHLIDIEGLEEILCNSFDEVWLIDRRGKRRVEPSPFRTDKEVRDFLNRIFAAQGRELNLAQPSADGFLADGSRIHANIPPVTPNGACFSIRKFRPAPFSMRDYLEAGFFTDEFYRDLKLWVEAGYTIVVSGGTASGKTTTLNALGELIPQTDRLLVIEDSRELQLRTLDTVNYVAMNTGARNRRDDAKAYTIRECLRDALRMRPDRIIIGEVRSHEAYDLLQALNTGHDGSLTTLHANSALDALSRLEALAASADEQVGEGYVQDLMARVIDVVIQVGRQGDTNQRAVYEAWQVIHPQKVSDTDRDRLAEARQSGELRHLRGNLWALPLYTGGERGQLTRRNDVVEVIGKRLHLVREADA